MPFKWEKKTNRVPASPERMKKAVQEVSDGCKLRTTAKKYNLDKMTLKRYVEKFRAKGEETKFTPNFATSQIFNPDEEKSLAEYLLIAARMNYGFTSKETRNFAYLFAKENEKKIPENWTKNKIASYEWLRGFMDRNKELSLRTPEPTSLSRGTAFNRHTVGEFYNLLGEVLRREQFEPDSIFNCDETGVQTVHKPSKIISRKGQKQVAKATSGERGQTVTVLCTISAIGNSVPPLLVFPRVREQDYMTNGAPPGSKAVTNPSGWMSADNFELYLLHFIKFVKCSKDKKVLLILDNHSSHISPNGLDICKQNGIVLLTIPPHTSHRLQPLDVAVYGPFKTYFNQACDDFMVQNPGQTISLKDIASLVGLAYQRAFTPLNITKGFSKTGIYPFNSHLFTDHDFLTAKVTDRPDPHQRERTPDATKPVDEERTSEYIPGPSCSYKTPEEIKPLPQAPPRKQQIGRKPVRTKILTDTPNMEEIKNEHEKRDEQRNKKKFKKNLTDGESTEIANMNKLVKKKKQKTIEEESESDTPLFDQSSSDEITDIEDQIENETIDEHFVTGMVNINDYVLVRFRTNKTSRHYVGKVLEKTDAEYMINFMRRKKPGYHFVYPDVVDQSLVPEEDVMKLPPPSFVGGTARSTRKLAFPVKFQAFDNVY